MNSKLLYFIVLPALFMTLANAMYLSVIGPITATLNNNQSVYLGKVGPGESFYVLASSTTTNATGYLVNIGWDKLNATQLPTGWIAQNSLLYANQMKVKITVPPTAQNGTYNITLRAINVQNYSRLGNLTIIAQINVTPNVFAVGVQPTVIASGINQPTNIYVTLNNTGISDDPFIINLHGLPAWNASDQVVALHLTQSSYVYPVYVNESGKYRFNLTVTSATSSALSVSYPITLTARDSLMNDYGSVGQGVLLSPVIFDPGYEVMLFVSYLYKQIVT